MCRHITHSELSIPGTLLSNPTMQSIIVECLRTPRQCDFPRKLKPYEIKAVNVYLRQDIFSLFYCACLNSDGDKLILPKGWKELLRPRSKFLQCLLNLCQEIFLVKGSSCPFESDVHLFGECWWDLVCDSLTQVQTPIEFKKNLTKRKMRKDLLDAYTVPLRHGENPFNPKLKGIYWLVEAGLDCAASNIKFRQKCWNPFVRSIQDVIYSVEDTDSAVLEIGESEIKVRGEGRSWFKLPLNTLEIF